MTFDANLITLIDQRIRLQAARDRAVGTCVSRATTGPAADVLFDASQVAMPVKVLGGVFLQPGDRCVLDKYGSDWVVTGSFSSLGLGESSYAAQGPVAGTISLTSSTFIDLPEIPPLLIDKAYDLTYMRMAISITAYSQTASSTVVFGLRWTSVEANGYPATDWPVTTMLLETGHEFGSASVRTGSIPAGRYSVQLRWRRFSGSGTPKLDGNDRVTIELDEGIRSSTPVL